MHEDDFRLGVTYQMHQLTDRIGRVEAGEYRPIPNRGKVHSWDVDVVRGEYCNNISAFDRKGWEACCNALDECQ